MPCDCSLCRVRAGGEPVRPPDCRCPVGGAHVDMGCFITKPEPTIVSQLLTKLGLPAGEKGVEAALLELVQARARLDDIPSIGYSQLPQDLKELVDRG